MTANPFPDGAEVEVPFPLTPEQKDGPRDAWPWLSGIVLAQAGPDEWDILVEDPRLATLEADGTETYPAAFWDASEIRPRQEAGQ